MAVRQYAGVLPPATFHNPPTVIRDGVRVLTDDAAQQLGDQVAHRYSSLLERLAAE